MMIGTLVWKKHYSLAQYGSALMLVLGLILFTLADVSVTPDFNIMGVVLVCGSLAADAFIGNVQEAVFAKGASQLEVMTWPSLFSCIIGSVFMLISDDPVTTIT